MIRKSTWILIKNILWLKVKNVVAFDSHSVLQMLHFLFKFCISTILYIVFIVSRIMAISIILLVRRTVRRPIKNTLWLEVNGIVAFDSHRVIKMFSFIIQFLNFSIMALSTKMNQWVRSIQCRERDGNVMMASWYERIHVEDS